MEVQWYPGHMNKARKQMQADLRNVELVIELLDARCPLSSRNPDIDKMAAGKFRLILLNKADLADNNINKAWKTYFEDRGIKVLLINSKQKEGIKAILPAVKEVCAERIQRNLNKGIKNQSIRAMVAGIPNVGKSTFINAFVGRNIARAADKPGVTRTNQWIKINSDLELLDTPGILWPKFEDKNVGLRLAMIGSINDEILVTEELCGELLMYLKDNYPNTLLKYGIDEELLERDISDIQFATRQSLMIDRAAETLKCLKKGGVPDEQRASVRILDDFRAGKIGHISLERPHQSEHPHKM